MTSIDQSLEYDGPYARRYACADCRYFANKSKTCAMIGNPAIKISGKNNVCRLFDAYIKNPSAPPFTFDDYLEKSYCSTNFPCCHVYYDKYTFEIDYRLYRELEFYRDGAIHYIEKRWQEAARKVKREFNGVEAVG